MPLPIDRSPEGITAVASFAGRVWYAGAGSKVESGDQRSPQYSGFVFFSQLITSIEKLNRCYQDASPTSEHISELIDTDGGHIILKNSGNIFKMVEFRDGLLIFAENGVWLVAGGEAGFTPLSAPVERITNVPVSGAGAVVDAENAVFFWSESGIQAIGIDPDTGRLGVRNITETTIQTLYTAISTPAKRAAKGVFDGAARQVRWQFNSSPTFSGSDSVLENDKELVFDFTLGAWYVSDITPAGTDSPFIGEYVQLQAPTLADIVMTVTIGGVAVTINSVNVTITEKVSQPISSSIKYFTGQKLSGGNFKYTFSFFRDNDFLDWKTNDSVGLDAPAFLLTGDEITDDIMRPKAATFIVTHFERTEDGFELDASGEIVFSNPSSALMQGRWEWSDSAASGKFTPQEQVYRFPRLFTPSAVTDPFDFGSEVITTKSKLPGSGIALRLRFDTEPGKDCRILGWGIAITGNTEV